MKREARDLLGQTVGHLARLRLPPVGVGELQRGLPGLDSLADNGGPTLTHALGVGSPAIDSADAGACPATDQRGVARPQGAGCDVGSFEYVP